MLKDNFFNKKNKISLTFLSIILYICYFFSFGYPQDFQSEIDAHYKKGLTLYNQGRYKEAQEEFQKAITLSKEKKKALSQAQPQAPQIEKKKPESKAKKEQTKPAQKFESIEYIIGEGDALLIKVWQNADLDGEVIVQPDGIVSFPLVGEIKAAGMTIKQFRQELTENLKEYIKHPQVFVSLGKLGGKKVIILGQVRGPGVYSVAGKRTILEVVGMAGGFTDDAVASSVVLVRGGFENPAAKRLNLTKALKKGDVRDNVILEAEDIVFVPRRFIADVNYFLKLILDPVSRGMYSTKEIRDW